MAKFTTFNTNSVRNATRGIQEYVGFYSDDDYPDEKLTAEQVNHLTRAVSALNAYLQTEGCEPVHVRATNGQLIMRGL